MRFSLQPCSSPPRFKGASTEDANLPPSSSTALMVSASTSACAGSALNSSVTLSSSCSTNCMSRNGGVYVAIGELLDEEAENGCQPRDLRAGLALRGAPESDWMPVGVA